MARYAGLILIFFVTTAINLCSGQNLIRNGDFEEFSNFDDFDFGYKDLENNVTTWRTPTSATPKIYSDEKTAKSGIMFSGIHLYGIRNYREYISTPLNCRLLEGETYVFRMYVKLSRNSEFAISSFGALLTEERPDVNTSGAILDTPQVFIEDKSFFDDSKVWVIVEDSFVAKGNEAFITIGNFLSDKNSVTKKVAILAREGRAYYYVDDVILYSKSGHDPCQAIIDSIDCEEIIDNPENLLRDPSFECYTSCPSNINTTELHQLEHWGQTAGTPDYYNSCSIIMNVPDNIMGSEDARSGYGYVGMYMVDRGDYREFLTAKLTEPLEKEKWYVIRLFAAMSENSGIATDAFEFLLTDKYPEIDSAELDDIKPQVINEPGNFADRYTWKKICGMYLAEGGEQYITMGNFNTNKNSAGSMKRVTESAGEFAYYFIDDFTIEPLNDSNMTECGAGIPLVIEDENITPTRYFQDLDLPELLNDEPFTFQGFYFEFDKYEILDTNYFFLDSLVDLLLENEDLKLQVEGHTDDVGSSSYNDKLSKNRAIAVVEYLISTGIDKKRIKMSYFGATRPVATNGTNEGRQLNRRCEFILKR